MKKEKEEEERERAEDEAREKKEKENESQHDKDKTKAEKEEEEKERAADEAGGKKEKSEHEDESEGEKDEGEDTERRGKKRPIAQRVISAADEKYDLVWQMYMRYKVSFFFFSVIFFEWAGSISSYLKFSPLTETVSAAARPLPQVVNAFGFVSPLSNMFLQSHVSATENRVSWLEL